MRAGRLRARGPVGAVGLTTCSSSVWRSGIPPLAAKVEKTSRQSSILTRGIAGGLIGLDLRVHCGDRQAGGRLVRARYRPPYEVLREIRRRIPMDGEIRRRSCWSSVLLGWLEGVLEVVVGDVGAECDPGQAGEAVVEAGPHTCVDDLGAEVV